MALTKGNMYATKDEKAKPKYDPKKYTAKEILKMEKADREKEEAAKKAEKNEPKV